jgi:butyrate kinase
MSTDPAAATVFVLNPGSLELEALSQGAWRVIDGKEPVREYV